MTFTKLLVSSSSHICRRFLNSATSSRTVESLSARIASLNISEKSTPSNVSGDKLQFLSNAIINNVEIGNTLPYPPRIEMPRIPTLGSIIIERKNPIVESPSDGRSMECPTVSDTVEKHAVRMIVIRRKKMRKHKRRKWRKKMKYVNMKKRRNKSIKRDKAFQNGLLAMVNEAKRFSAEVYVSEKLRKAYEKVEPMRWKGKIVPEFIYKQLLANPKKNFKQF